MVAQSLRTKKQMPHVWRQLLVDVGTHTNAGIGISLILSTIVSKILHVASLKNTRQMVGEWLARSLVTINGFASRSLRF